MLRNYLKVTLRNIFKHKGYAFINISGLAIGMACCLLITIWVLHELSFDKFHENASTLYRVEEDQYYTERVFHVTVTPYPLGPALIEEIPEIKDAARVVWAGGSLFRYGDNAHYENNVRAVDPSFLQMFTFPLLRGDKDSALDSPYSLIVNEEIAEKYFGSEDPMGKVITVSNEHEFTVTGVLKKMPDNSSLQYEMLVPYAFLEKIGMTNQQFGSNSISTYVQLEESASMAQVNEKIKGFIKSKVPRSLTDLVLMPYTRMHLYGYFGYGKPMGAIQYVYIFSIIALFVLVIACINFMNLATARSANRAREVGMRKVVGALKGNLIRQFYSETVVFAILALFIAVVLVTLLLEPFGNFAQKDLSWKVSGIGSILLGLIGITIFTGIVAGSYPALYLSAFQPVRVLKGTQRSGKGAARFRKVLVVFQFALSILLIIGTTVVYKQLRFMQQKKLGWDKEHVLVIPMRAGVRDSYNPLKQELLGDTRVLSVSGARERPSHIGSNSWGADWEGRDPNFTILISQNSVDFDFIETFKIEMKEGRSFSPEYASDQKTAFLVNEEVAKLMGKELVVGERFRFQGVNGTIVGVMKNFHFQSLRQKIEPLAIRVSPQSVNFMFIRLAPGNISGSIQYIEETWNRVLPSFPFEYFFMDEDFERMYVAEQRIGTLLNYFAALAVFIACLGLFGLASFTAEQRTKEIGIRKVLGASIQQITTLLCQEFFLLVVLANIIAWPLAYLMMDSWLDNYAFRTGLGIPIFALALGLALLIALLSVSFQAIRAALANPANAIKYE